VSRKTAILKWYAQAKRRKVKCRLHPLIHTLLEFTLTHDIDSCQGKGFEVTLIPDHLGSLGGKRESEVGNSVSN
jgi:hypothetical protein